MDVHKSEFQIGQLVDICTRTIEPLAGQKGIELKTNISPDLPALLTDQDKLKQILINLLGNAVKFTEQGSVKIDVSDSDGQILLGTYVYIIEFLNDKGELFTQRGSFTIIK